MNQSNTYIGPKPISKNDTYAITKNKEAILLKNPKYARAMADMNIPPADHKMRVRLLVLSINNNATYVAATFTPPTIVVPNKGLSITPSKNIVE